MYTRAVDKLRLHNVVGGTGYPQVGGTYTAVHNYYNWHWRCKRCHVSILCGGIETLALQSLLQRLPGNSRLSGMSIAVAIVPKMPTCAIPHADALQWYLYHGEDRGLRGTYGPHLLPDLKDKRMRVLPCLLYTSPSPRD